MVWRMSRAAEHGVSMRRNLDLAFSRSKAIQSAHAGGVLWLDLDRIDHRYLLAGGADGSIAAYDVQVVSQAG